MEVLKLIAVFAAIILILRMKRPLWLALCCGALATVALYGLSPLETLRLAVRSVLSAGTLVRSEECRVGKKRRSRWWPNY